MTAAFGAGFSTGAPGPVAFQPMRAFVHQIAEVTVVRCFGSPVAALYRLIPTRKSASILPLRYSSA